MFVIACAGVAACHRGPGTNWVQLASNKVGVIYLDTVRTHAMDSQHAIAIMRYELTVPAPVDVGGVTHHAAAIESVERVDCSTGRGQIERVTAFDSAGFQLKQEQRDPPDQDDLSATQTLLCAFVARRAAGQ